MGGGANKTSLVEAQKNFTSIGAKDKDHLQHSRKPTESDVRDKDWRVIDENKNDIEIHVSGVDEGLTYPKDLTKLYYWKK
jgi:hypothetical protein